MPDDDLDAFFALELSPAETFQRFWAAYPPGRREAKKDALKAWIQLKPDAALVDLIVTHLQTRRWPEQPKFIPLPATFIRGYRWTDEAVAGGLPEPLRPANRWTPTANPKRLIHGGQGMCCPHEPICETDVDCWRRQQGVPVGGL